VASPIQDSRQQGDELAPLDRRKRCKQLALDLLDHAVELLERIHPLTGDRHDVSPLVIRIDPPLDQIALLKFGHRGGDVASINPCVAAEVRLARRPPLLQSGQQPVVIPPQAVAAGLEAGGEQGRRARIGAADEPGRPIFDAIGRATGLIVTSGHALRLPIVGRANTCYVGRANIDWADIGLHGMTTVPSPVTLPHPPALPAADRFRAGPLFVAATRAAHAEVGPSRAGRAAAAILNSSQQLDGNLGPAIFTAVDTAVRTTCPPSTPPPTRPRPTAGIRCALAADAALAIAPAAITLTTANTREDPNEVHEPVPDSHTEPVPSPAVAGFRTHMKGQPP
jgi:hypothetical protein